MRGKIVKLRRISRGAPEQWEGELSTGEHVFARERHGVVRIELDDITIHETLSNSALEEMYALFEIECEAWE